MSGVNPYEPTTAITGTEGAASEAVTLTPGAVAQIAPADPQRLYLLVFPFSSDVVVTPFYDFPGYGWFGSITPGSSPILIHQASYGPLVNGEWYARSAAGGILRVVDCRTNR